MKPCTISNYITIVPYSVSQYLARQLKRVINHEYILITPFCLTTVETRPPSLTPDNFVKKIKEL